MAQVPAKRTQFVLDKENVLQWQRAIFKNCIDSSVFFNIWLEIKSVWTITGHPMFVHSYFVCISFMLFN